MYHLCRQYAFLLRWLCDWFRIAQQRLSLKSSIFYIQKCKTPLTLALPHQICIVGRTVQTRALASYSS